MELRNRKIVQSLKNIAGQKFTWFAFLMVCVTFTAFNTRPDSQASFGEDEAVAETAVTPAIPSESITSTTDLTATTALEEELPAIERINASNTKEADIERLALKTKPSTAKKSTSKLISYAQSLLGTPYNYGGITTEGFDCSGYIYHVYTKHDFEMERSSQMQSTQGNVVAVEQVLPGDLLFFTGTNADIREVGHVGIVISEPGEPVTFIHSSSNGGVKISELEGYYTTRFMFAKRLD